MKSSPSALPTTHVPYIAKSKQKQPAGEKGCSWANPTAPRPNSVYTFFTHSDRIPNPIPALDLDFL